MKQASVVYHLHWQTSRFLVWQILSKLKTGKFRAGIAFTICTNQFYYQKAGTGIRDGFEEMEHKFSFGTFRPGKQDYLCRCCVAPGIFPPKRPEKSCTIYFSTGLSGNFL